ncbi:transposable element Tcb1 transposase [Trichonephila clavipes]|nr:transposable element Tcb1 transposase [Trichonephila clavipes]
MRISNHWMQKCTMDRRGQSHPPQCTTSREDMQIVRMAVTDRSVTSRNRIQLIESVTHYSVSARTIGRHLQQRGLFKTFIAWSTLDAEPQTSPPLMSATPRGSYSSLDTPWREDGKQLRYALPHWSCTWYYGIGDIGYNSRTLLVCIAGTLISQRNISEVLDPVVLPYLQGLATAIFQQLMVALRLTQITPSAATPDHLWQRAEAAWSSVPQEHIQSLFESMPRRVAAVISNNGGCSSY